MPETPFSEPQSYSAAAAELELILQQLQRGEIAIDELIAKAKRASELLSYCKQKLRSTSEALDELFPEDPVGEA